MCELGYPLVIGRKNGVTVTDGGTTEAEVTMIDFGYGVYFDNPPQNSTAIQNPDSFDWGTGLLPQTIAKDGYTFDGWYTDNTFSQKMTELPDTTDWKNLKRPAAKFTQGGGQGQQGGNNQGNNNTLVPQGGTGLYFARATGEGDGTSPSDAKAFSELISALNSGDLEPHTGNYITIYLLDDISSGSTIVINKNVKIIGAKNGYLNQKSTITRTDDTSTPVFAINNEISCFLDDLIIDGSTDETAETAAHQGISNGGTLTLNKCNIKNCTATNGAGISNSGTAVLTLTDSFIGNCTATTRGGGIYSVSNGSVTLSGTKITGCNVNTTSNEAKGGGIYCDTGSLTLKDGSTVSGCNAYNNGGGIYFSSSGTLTITDSTIGGDNESDKCTARYGGGISTTGTGSLEINGTSKIKNCTATKYGGGLYLLNTYDSNQITLNGTTISYCEANDGNSSGQGGGIYVKCTANNNDYPALTISHCTIDHCTVREYGGAISIISGTMSVSETTISNCSAVKGGALFCQSTCTLDTGTFFTECTASDAGGALYGNSSGCKLTLKSNSQIDNCSATKTGGAIFLYYESTVTLESGAQITNCTAPFGGGIALNTNANLTLTNGAIITGCEANNSKNSLGTISNGIINGRSTGESKQHYNYDITADDIYNSDSTKWIVVS